MGNLYVQYKYSYATTIIISRGKLGDATREIYAGGNNLLTSGWNNSSSNLIREEIPWFIRGGRGTNTSGGIFAYSGTQSTNNGEGGDQTSRPVLTITRDFPWKDN